CYYRSNYEDTGKEIEEFQRYLTIFEFPDLEKIIVEGLSCFKELAMLIEKTKGNISYIEIDMDDKTAKNAGILIKAIADNCPRIKSLATYLEPKDFFHVKSLLQNCRTLENVKFRCIDYFANESDNVGDKLLDILTQFSPNSLIEIELDRGWKYSLSNF